MTLNDPRVGGGNAGSVGRAGRLTVPFCVMVPVTVASASLVTVLADSGDRYTDTYFCAEWLANMELDTSGPAAKLSEFEESCSWS